MPTKDLKASLDGGVVVFRLVGTRTCPYVQRVIAAMEVLGVRYDNVLIDIDDPPSWFPSLSPMGRVPVLETDGAAMFESIAILEYLDEREGGLLPEGDLARARDRAWAMVGNEAQEAFYRMTIATPEPAFKKARAHLYEILGRVEQAKGSSLFWRGEDFGFVDCIFAPLLQRLEQLSRRTGAFDLTNFPSIEDWTYALLRHPAIQASSPERHEDEILSRVAQRGGYVGGLIGA